MIETGLRILKSIEDAGFRAYLVGGLPRDYLLGMDTNDVDITTNATPKDLISIFTDAKMPSQDYGSVRIIRNSIAFQIVTFRKEGEYDNLRRPTKVEYISSLTQDLKRRDFTINTICMDSEGKIIDLLGGRAALKAKMVDTIGDAVKSFREDPLRILRAIRFATVLDFNLSDGVISAIKTEKEGLKILSRERIKFELDKMFISKHYLRGVRLLKEFGLDKILALNNLEQVKAGLDVIGIWSILESDKYIKRASEKKIIREIRKYRKLDLSDPLVLFEAGGYVSQVAGFLKGISKKEMSKRYNELPIKFKSEVKLNGNDIKEILDIDAKEISRYQKILLEAILYNKVNNTRNDLIKFLEAYEK